MSAEITSAVAAVNSLRKSVKPTPFKHLGMERMDIVDNPFATFAKNYTTVFMLCGSGLVSIIAYESVAIESSWHAVVPLSECGVPTHKKLAKSATRGSLYMKEGVVYYALVGKDKTPLASVKLDPCEMEFVIQNLPIPYIQN